MILNDIERYWCLSSLNQVLFKWKQRYSSPQSLSFQANTKSFSKTVQMIELCCEYFSARCICLYFIIMPSAHFSVNLHSKLPECQGTPCSKQAPYLKFKWQQRDSNPQPLRLKTNTQIFSQTGQTIELCFEFLSVVTTIHFYVKCTVQKSTYNTAQSFGQFG